MLGLINGRSHYGRASQDRVPLQLPLTAPNEFVGQIYFARLGAP